MSDSCRAGTAAKNSLWLGRYQFVPMPFHSVNPCCGDHNVAVVQYTPLWPANTLLFYQCAFEVNDNLNTILAELLRFVPDDLSSAYESTPEAHLHTFELGGPSRYHYRINSDGGCKSGWLPHEKFPPKQTYNK
eukprot:1498653-Amphidinium_carterae.1